MQMQTENQTSRRRLNAHIVKPADFEAGDTLVVGKMIGEKSMPWVNKETGEETELHHFVFQTENGTIFLRSDGGLRNAMAMAGAVEGDTIEVVKLEQKAIKDKRINQYDIFSA